MPGDAILSINVRGSGLLYVMMQKRFSGFAEHTAALKSSSLSVEHTLNVPSVIVEW